ncbi:hypothetical protein [Pollutibacter soli]|uniref:site-specific recombinase n=1 Tax=Pollutibacter soli TaxID=3034157 RepID=UPI003013C239
MVEQTKRKTNLVYHFRDNKLEIRAGDRSNSLAYLRDFIALIRPRARRFDDAEANMQLTLKLLYEEPGVVSNLRRALLINLVNADMVPTLTDSGMALSRSVGKELYGRLKHKFIPPVTNQNDFLYVIDVIFYKSYDFKWVEKIERESWLKFFELLGLSFRGAESGLVRQVMVSLEVLSARVAQLGWEKDLADHLPINEKANPFMVQLYLLRELKICYENEAPWIVNEKAEELLSALKYCRETIDQIKKNSDQFGASLAQSFILYQLEQKIERMLLLVDLIDTDQRFNMSRLVNYFLDVVRNETRRNSIRELLSQTTGYLAYQIAEQKSRKGSSYITSSPAEYRKMIYSAMGGGLIICFVAVFKNLLAFFKMAPFWQGFAYSINYSLGFIFIEETKSTLATKQPAFTASAVAVSMDSRKADHQPNLYNLAVTISKVSRSQIASFAGNLLIVFPGTYLLAWAFDAIFKKKIASGPAAFELLKAQHPWESLSLLYACNTGVFLFLSGIIAGYVQNKMKFGKLSERIIQHPLLRFNLSKNRLASIAAYWDSHAGSLIGNITLGFFLGMASSIVKIFGIPFDIRHITISAGNASIGLYGVGWDHIGKSYLLIVFFGILAIGFFNFLVSFTLAFFVAVRSRGIRLNEYPEFFQILWKYFKANPLDFIRPRKRISETIETTDI